MNQIVSAAKTSTRPLLVKGGSVITMDPAIGDVHAADILIVNGAISEIGPGIHAPDAEIIEAAGHIVMPGFVDSHRHLWEGLIRNSLADGTLADYFRVVNGMFGPAYRPQDVYAGSLLSALGALDAGVTTVLDWAHIQNSPEHTDASIAALRESGLRAVFGFGTPTAEDQGHRYPDDILRLRREVFSSEDQLLTLALATTSPEHAPDAVVKARWRKGREAGARLTVHAGIAGFGKPGEIERFGREGMLGPDLTLVHCATFNDTEWKMIADNGVTVSISTPIELQMGHGMPPIQKAVDVGLCPSLSVDVETSTPGDFFTQMRATLALQRGLAFARSHAGEPSPALLGVRNVLEFATMGGAKANGLAPKVGSITKGKQADLIVLRTKALNVMPINDLAGAVVLGMDTSNVDTVIVAGRVVKRGGRMVGVDMERLAGLVYDARDRVFAKAGVPHGGMTHSHAPPRERQG
jgi:5-methylthioadenosine/S-adenosylhomocysteine deaminase